MRKNSLDGRITHHFLCMAVQSRGSTGTGVLSLPMREKTCRRLRVRLPFGCRHRPRVRGLPHSLCLGRTFSGYELQVFDLFRELLGPECPSCRQRVDARSGCASNGGFVVSHSIGCLVAKSLVILSLCLFFPGSLVSVRVIRVI